MKKLFFSFILVTIVATSSFSQTKKIANRSHSGQDSEFNINGDDNFGLPPSTSKAKTDSSKKDSSKIKVDTSKKTLTKVKPRKTKKLYTKR